MEDSTNYRELMLQDYPEEMEPGGFVEWARNRFQYLDKHPERWAKEAAWIRETWKQNPEEAVLKYCYEFLHSFA